MMEFSSVETFSKFKEQFFTEEINRLRKEVSDLRTEMYEFRRQETEKKISFLRYTMLALSIILSVAVLITLFITPSH